MPSKSKAQMRFMTIAANDPEFADKVGVPQSVAMEFHAADKARGRPPMPKSPKQKMGKVTRRNGK